jgi:DNA-3-methyladenine glycosylase
MNINRALNGADLLGTKLWLERPASAKRARIARATRIGVDYSGEWAERPWRFFDRDSPYVSTVTASARAKALKSALNRRAAKTQISDSKPPGD